MRHEDVADVLAGLEELGALKPGEEARTLHARGCPALVVHGGSCDCPGGPELVYADWSECTPARELARPVGRFHARR